MAARVVLAAVAILVLAWVGVLLRDYQLGHEAALHGFFAPAKAPAERQRDLQRLDEVQLLDPSAYWDGARATYLMLIGDTRAAATAAEALVKDEPENLLAWGVLRAATRESDPSLSARATEQIRRLNPLGSQ